MTETTNRIFRPPVRWLFGSKLVFGIKWILLYAVSGKKGDPRNWMRAQEDDSFHRRWEREGRRDEAFWFDYVADTGDGHRSTYSLAYLCLSSLWVDANGELSSPRPQAHRDATELPRGEFLVVGGDTAYHIADYPTLGDRFQRPFCWAAADVAEKLRATLDVREVFGLPGNHDYYDFLDGFNRQFRKPYDENLDGECPGEDLSEPDTGPLLRLGGFKRSQEASYFALRLPHGWRLWGLDTKDGQLDRRQRHFFRQLAKSDTDKLVIATAEPPIVFGRGRRRTLDEILAPESEGKTGTEELGCDESPVANGSCRLDLAGDVHHYARYGGPDEGRPSNYASVVAGGGAFLHPTQTDFDEIEIRGGPYPDRRTSHHETIGRLLNPLNIVRGGWLLAAGAVIAVLLCWAVTVEPSSKDAGARIFHHLGLTLETGDDPSAIVGHELIVAVGLVVGFFGILAVMSSARKGRLPLTSRPIAVYVGLGLLAAGLTWVVAANGAPHPFARSVLITCALLLTAGLLVWNARYRESLFQRARTRYVGFWDFFPSVLQWIAAALVPILAVAEYGTEPVKAVTGNVLTILVVAGLFIGLPLYAVVAGAGRQPAKGKALFLFLGAWHAFVQLVVPVSLVVFLAWTPLVLTMAGIVLFGLSMIPVARWLWPKVNYVRQPVRLGMLFLFGWILLGAVPMFVVENVGSLQSMTSARFGAAVVVGALSSCTNFGWYLATALAFKGHNNEAGGAARLEKYRHFLRIKLTKEGATVYAIGVDEPTASSDALRPRIVDRFELRSSGP